MELLENANLIVYGSILLSLPLGGPNTRVLNKNNWTLRESNLGLLRSKQARYPIAFRAAYRYMKIAFIWSVCFHNFFSLSVYKQQIFTKLLNFHFPGMKWKSERLLESWLNRTSKVIGWIDKKCIGCNYRRDGSMILLGPGGWAWVAFWSLLPWGTLSFP